MPVWTFLSGCMLCLVLTPGWTQPETAPGPDRGVQWASRVVGASSEAKGEMYGRQYKAVQALGRPSKLPQTGDSPCAWAPLYPENPSEEWIHVGFARPMRARQIVVAENMNPGAVSRVVVIDEAGKEHSVYENDNPTARPEPLLRVFPKDSGLIGREVKVVLMPGRVKGVNQIDAIGISDQMAPVSLRINVAQGTPVGLAKENLGKGVNSPGEELAPVISPDGRTLYFTRSGHKGNVGKPDRQDVWVSTLTSSGTSTQWGEAINLGPPINNANDNAVSCLSLDGRTMYLLNVYKPNGEMEFGLSKSVKTRAGWSTPKDCKITDNYNLPSKPARSSTQEELEPDQAEFCIGPEGNVIVMAVRRRDTEGDRDLYVSFLQADKVTWSEPRSLGKTLNTADFESSPFLAADGRTLYFTSAGHPGFGDGDIFVSRRLDDTWTNWSEPENLGPAINTAEWDGYFTIPAAGDYAYLSSSANSLGEDDIFRLKLFTAIKPDPVAIVSGQVFDVVTKKAIASEVMAGLVKDSKAVSKAEYNPETGEYKLILATQKAYNLMVTKAGYFPLTELLDLSKDKRFRDIRRNLYLTPIESGQKVTMREVLFEQSKPALLPGSDAELNRLTDMLKQYPDMEILVEGHTDNQGEWALNVKLSEDRVQVVKAYLVAQGIAETRIQTKAWGPSKPVASNETDEKRRQNRRVEFTILKR
ncbi:MAG: OmpA family protein [Bacteroidetes bacterium]|nr:OmpA family protein [Fibrella sp.]